jgi:MoxR-like ATPase
MSLFSFSSPLAIRNGLIEKWPSQWRDAARYNPDDELKLAIELALSLERPLLLTGDPGCGKTTAAYWAAWMLGAEPLPATESSPRAVHIQVRSDTTAKSLKYDFDTIRYFRDAQLSMQPNSMIKWDQAPGTKKNYITEGPLWKAFKAEGDVVILFDEIDKAPPDLPNDLLLELDRFRFEVPELEREIVRGKAHGRKTLCIITSNGQRPLPDAFLRRCLHHHIDMDMNAIKNVVERRLVKGEGEGESDSDADRDISIDKDLCDFAIEQFERLLQMSRLVHKPGLGELLTWLQAISLDSSGLRLAHEKAYSKDKDRDLSNLPYLQALLKSSQDLKMIKRKA